MIIEFQISTSAFLTAQLASLQSQQICSPPPFSIGPYQIVVDHIGFGANAIRNSVQTTAYIFFEQAVYGTESQAIQGLQVQLAQDITVFLADQNDILAHPNQPPALIVPIPATVIVNLNYFASGNNDCYLGFSYDHLELGTLPPLPPGIDQKTIQQQAQSLAKSLVPSQTIPFDLIKTVLGTGTVVENAGMSVDAGLSRIAFRAETPTSSPFTPDAWKSFLNGNVPDRLQGSDWGFFIDQDVLCGIIAQPVSQGLAGNSDFELVTGVGATYSNPAPDRAHVQVAFSGNVDGKICTVWTDVFVDNDITVSAPNTLAVDMNLSWNTATTLCTVTAALLGAALGGLVDLIMPFVAAIINPITGFLLGIATVLYLKNTLGPPNQKNPNCTKLTDSHYSCTQKMAVTQVSQFGKLGFTQLAALSDGVSFLGQLQPAPLTAAVIEPSFTQFRLKGPVISCEGGYAGLAQNFQSNPTNFVTAEAFVTLDNSGSAPLYLCSFSVQNDPLGVFQNAVSVISEGGPIQIEVGVAYPSPAYFASPYSCQLLLFTNGGIRLVSIPPIPVLTQQTITDMLTVIVIQVGDCQTLVDPWFNLFHRYNPAWSVDPPPGSTVEHWWNFVVNGLQPGDTVTLVDVLGQTLVEANAQAGASTSVDALVSPAAAGATEVGLIHGGAGVGAGGGAAARTARAAGAAAAPGAAPPAAQQGIGMTQRLLVRRSVINLVRPAARIGTCRFGRAACAFVVLEDGIELYNLSAPTQPRLGDAWSFPARGAIATNNSLLGFGDDGFVQLRSAAAARRVPPECCEARRIADAIAAFGVIYVVGDDALQVYSPGLRLLGKQPLPGALRLARVGKSLYAAGANGLGVFDLTKPENPRLVDNSITAVLADLTVPADSGGRTLLVVPANGPAWQLSIDGGPPMRIAQYPQTPWFLNAARLPRLLLRLIDGNTSIVISEFGAAKIS